MEAVDAKVITIFCLLIITLLLGIIPYFIIRRGRDHVGVSRTREKILSYLNCFAGGVFLGTALLHLLVEGREDLEDVLTNVHNVTGYPVFESLVGAGFFLIALLEQLALLCMAGVAVSSVSDSTKVHRVYHENEATIIGEKSPLLNKRDSDETTEAKPRTSSTSELERSIAHTHDFDVSAASGIRAFLLLLALSFHTIFDGLAVGLQVEDTDVWEVFGAISVHKILVAFCLGLQLFRAFQPFFKKAFLCLLLFSLMSPIGIAIGIAVTSSNLDESAEKMTSGILQGIACGTFLYVTCFEILRDELSHKSSVPKVIISAIGFSAMIVVKLIDQD